MKEPVGVLLGGSSAEREISLQSGQAVLKALKRLGVQSVALDTAAPMRDWLNTKLSAAFIALHGSDGEDGVVQGALQTAGIPYTGSGVLASALAMDKWRSRQLFRQAGVAVPATVNLGQGDSIEPCYALGEQLFVKPNNQGSSLGCSRVGGNHASLPAALKEAFQYSERVLVEPWLDGGEYFVGILDSQPLPAIKVESSRAFYDYVAKYQSGYSQYHLPCGLSPEQEAQLQQSALAAWRALGCSGWGRVDLMASADQFLVLEINTVPGMTENSLMPKAAAHLGIDFDQLVGRIVASAAPGGSRT